MNPKENHCKWFNKQYIFVIFFIFLWLQSLTAKLHCFFLLSWGVKWSLVQKTPWSMSSLSAYGRLVFYFVIYFSLGKGFLLCIFLSMLFQPERIAGLFAVCIIRLMMGTYSQSLTSDKKKPSKINTFFLAKCWTLPALVVIYMVIGNLMIYANCLFNYLTFKNSIKRVKLYMLKIHWEFVY